MVDLSNIKESRIQDLSLEDPGIEEAVEYLSSGGGGERGQILFYYPRFTV